MLICSFSWSKFEFIIFFTCLMFLRIPEASNAFKWMFFDALEIQEPSQIDPGWIWEFFFMKIFKKLTLLDDLMFKQSHQEFDVLFQIFHTSRGGGPSHFHDHFPRPNLGSHFNGAATKSDRCFNPARQKLWCPGPSGWVAF